MKLVISKPESDNLTRKTAKTLNFNLVKKSRKKPSFFANTKVQIGQIKRKIVAKVYKSLLIQMFI